MAPGGRRAVVPGRRAAGLSIFVATGDFGAYNCRADDPSDLDRTTDWPSGSQYVVAVGGRASRSARRVATLRKRAGKTPSRVAAAAAGSPCANRNPPGRRVPVWPGPIGRPPPDPDVAAAADPDSGFFSVWRDEGDDLVQGSIGGTSAATPSGPPPRPSSGRRQGQGQDRAGPVGAAAVPGRRRRCVGIPRRHAGRQPGVRRRPRWDFATGLGSPDVARLANALIDALPEARPPHRRAALGPADS